MFHKESYSQTFCDIHRISPVQGSIFNKIAAIRFATLSKRDSNTCFLANIGKFIRRPVLKNICKRLHCWKVFCENVFQKLLEKSFMKNRIKYRKYFSAQQVSKFEEISTLNICDGAKQICPKKQKNLLRRDIL